VADPSQGGDCEDLALAARQKLLARGWPLGALRIAVGWTEQGEYHTVLSVDVTTKSGAAQTYILDGRQRRVESWTALKRQGYRWDRRQTANGGDWVAIRG
jgi:predicted transglutaminase-like cysteine proteinase